MAFVYEKIPQADLKRYDFSAIKSAPLFLDPIAPFRWTIDRERDVFLCWVGSGGESDPHLHHFALWFHGDVIYARMLEALKGNTGTWKLVNLRVPAHAEPRRDEILGNLKEALTAYGAQGVLRLQEVRFEF